KTLSPLSAAQMNHRGELLLLRQADLGRVSNRQNAEHALVQVRGGHFDGMSRDNPRIEVIEPTGLQIVPWAFAHNRMTPDAIFPRLSECTVGYLKQAHRARGRTINLKWAPRPLPAPISVGKRIAIALGLRQSGETFS